MIDEIVACLVGSDFSEKILPFAAELAKELRAGLQLLQVLEATTPGSQDFAGLRGDILESF